MFSKYLILCILELLILDLSKPAYSQEVSAGTIENFIFQNSEIYPGTTREISVYIPYQLDKRKKVCVYVQQDGIRRKAIPGILDTLIARGDIPLMVGVFIHPGLASSPVPETIYRRNRSFEYDGLGDRYVRFILEEILPYIKIKYGLNISEDGNDRAIGGSSSGGIAAFNVAWERPDAFSRVYCNSGSFVGFRGGNEFPILVRKTAPKQIRAYLTTGTDDMENCAGDWTLTDLQMEKALRFSGYDIHFELIEGGHGVCFEQCFENAMKYIWRGWPEKVLSPKGAPRVMDIILPDEPWKLVGKNFFDLIGGTNNEIGEVFFSDRQTRTVYKINHQGKVMKVFEETCSFDDLTFDKKGDMYGISEDTGEIWKVNMEGENSLFANGFNAKFLSADPDGSIWVSGIAMKPGTIIKLISQEDSIVFETGLSAVADIAISPDHWLLALADFKSKFVYSFDISDGRNLLHMEPYFKFHTPQWNDKTGASSICYDMEGHLLMATDMGIQVSAWDGPSQVIIPVPEGQPITSLCLGGKNLDELFVFCGDKIYSRKVKVHAIGAFTPWTARSKGKL